ncbi:MAG: SBBP repeat-containing protein, partial [Candidatus Dormiibacterota bacterium]
MHFASSPRGTDDLTSHPRLRSRALGVAAAALPLAAAFTVGAPLSTAHAAANSGTVATPTYVRTIGTSGESTMYPSGVAVDAAGNVYV